MVFLKSIFGGGKVKTELFTPPPPPSSNAIFAAESALKIKFPDSFIAFLQRSRDMQLPICTIFYWVGDEDLGADNIVAANFRERAEVSSPIPEPLIAFYNDGMGNQICFDLRIPNKDGEFPIVFWDHELSPEENLAVSRQDSHHLESAGIIAQSFPEWLGKAFLQHRIH
jgi:hypothetical protein